MDDEVGNYHIFQNISCSFFSTKKGCGSHSNAAHHIVHKHSSPVSYDNYNIMALIINHVNYLNRS